MSYHSEAVIELLREYAIETARENAWYSAEDGAFLTFVVCRQCGKGFYDELEACEQRIRQGGEHVCIRCDSEAEKSSGVSGVLFNGMLRL